MTPGAFQTALAGYQDVFATKVNSAGSALVYSTYLGGTGFDEGRGIAVDSSGNAYIAGRTESANFPTQNALQPAYKGGEEAFVTKLNSTGSALVYSTFLGGTGDDYGVGIAVDGSGDAYVTGATTSTDFPTKNPFQQTNNGGYDAFLSEINPAGSDFVLSTYLGGAATDFAFGVTVDSLGQAHLVGYTGSSNFPVQDAVQSALNGAQDLFITKFNSTGSALLFSTYLGGSANDISGLANGIAVDGNGNIYVTGSTNSSDFPVVNAFDPTWGGDPFSQDAIAVKISGTANGSTGAPQISISPTQITFPPTPINTTSAMVTVTITNTGTVPLSITALSTQPPFAVLPNSNIASIQPGGQGTFGVTFSPTGPGPYSGTVSITSNAPTSPTTISVQGTVLLPTPTVNTISPSSGNQGATVTVTVTGSNLFSGATLSLIGTAETFTATVNSVSADNKSVTASFAIPATAALELKNIVVANIGSNSSLPLPNAFRVDREFLIFAGPAAEPSIAVDPTRPAHMVVGYNYVSNNVHRCGWSETTNGRDWYSGTLSFPKNFKAVFSADPWVRFGPNGELLYSCLGVSNTTLHVFSVATRQVGVFVFMSTGFASDLATKQPAFSVTQFCSSAFSCTGDQFPTPDHPSITVMKRGTGFRIAACWIIFPFVNITPLVAVATSDDGITWSTPGLAGQGVLCAMGGDGSDVNGPSLARLAVTWLDSTSNSLMVRTSSDGINWQLPQRLEISDVLDGGSATDKVHARPYSLIEPTRRGLYLTGQIRNGGKSNVVVRAISATDRAVIDSAVHETFLPGVGTCGRVAGMYELMAPGIVPPGTPFRYTGWLTDNTVPILAFTSGADLYASNAFPVSANPPYTLNEYTGADCSNSFGWLVWTDVRNGQQIWGAQIPLIPQ